LQTQREAVDAGRHRPGHAAASTSPPSRATPAPPSDARSRSPRTQARADDDRRRADDDKQSADDDKRRADDDKRRTDLGRREAANACTKGDMSFNRFAIIAGNLWMDERYAADAPNGAAWSARKKDIAHCGVGTCLHAWHEYVAKSKALANWASERMMSCPGLTDACGAPQPLQSNAVDVDCTGYEESTICVDALDGMRRDTEELERFNTCAIQYVDWFRAHAGEAPSGFAAQRSYTPPVRKKPVAAAAATRARSSADQ
jgi:hypothetical protein